jgi:hypothetical protein
MPRNADRWALRSARQGQQALDPLSGVQADSFRDLAYRLAGGADEAPWWRDSHERVLQEARALDWPSRLSGVEDQTCELVGGQFYDNLQAHDGGHHQAQWLRALVEYVGAALRKAVTEGGDWQPLWTLLYGAVLTTPESAARDGQEAALRDEFPDIKDPYATAGAARRGGNPSFSFRTVRCDFPQAPCLWSHASRSPARCVRRVRQPVPRGGTVRLRGGRARPLVRLGRRCVLGGFRRRGGNVRIGRRGAGRMARRGWHRRRLRAVAG